MLDNNPTHAALASLATTGPETGDVAGIGHLRRAIQEHAADLNRSKSVRLAVNPGLFTEELLERDG